MLQQLKTLPNLLSALRLALVPVFLLLLLSNNQLWSIIVLAFSGLTDFLDGFLARKLNQTTRLGQLLDPAADRLYIFATLVGLSATGHIPFWLMIIVVSLFRPGF